MRFAARVRLTWVALVVAGSAAAACGSVQAAPDRPTSTTAPAAAAAATSATLPPCQPAPLEVRAATVVVVGIGDGTTVDDPLIAEIADLGVGGVTLRPPNIVDADQVTTLIDGIRQRSPRPLLVGVDEEGGRVSRLRELIGPSPSARRLGQRAPAEITDHAAGRGEAIRELGFDLTFAPVVDADDGPSDGPIGDRSFAPTPTHAGSSASAFARGLRRAGVLGVAKHFPGQGGIGDDTHVGSAVSDAAIGHVTRAATGFRAVIADDVPAVMVSHVTFTALGPRPASLEPATYRLLRSLGFDGVAMTDSLGMGAVVQRWPVPEAAVLALAAGADVALANQGDQATAMRDAIVAAVRAGRLPGSRLDEAVGRVLELRGEDPSTMLCGWAGPPSGDRVTPPN